MEKERNVVRRNYTRFTTFKPPPYNKKFLFSKCLPRIFIISFFPTSLFLSPLYLHFRSQISFTSYFEQHNEIVIVQDTLNFFFFPWFTSISKSWSVFGTKKIFLSICRSFIQPHSFYILFLCIFYYQSSSLYLRAESFRQLNLTNRTTQKKKYILFQA